MHHGDGDDAWERLGRPYHDQATWFSRRFPLWIAFICVEIAVVIYLAASLKGH